MGTITLITVALVILEIPLVSIYGYLLVDFVTNGFQKVKNYYQMNKKNLLNKFKDGKQICSC